MASGSGSKVRIVKCPKCLRALLEDEDVPVYQCGGCFTILQAKKRNVSANGAPSSAETEGILQPTEPQRVSEFKESTSSSSNMVVPSSGEFSAGQENENGENGSVESIEEQLAGVSLSNGEQSDDIQPRGTSSGHSEQNEGGENSRFEAEKDIEAVAADQGFGSGSSSVDHVAAARETTLSPDILTASPDEEEHDQGNKALSAYDGSVSSSDGREDQLAPSTVVSPEERPGGKSVLQDRRENKERGTSSSALLAEENHNRTRHKKFDQTRSQQLEGSGERLQRQERQEFQSYMPFYRQGPSFSSAYEHGSPSYQSNDDFDGHYRAFSLQMPPYAGGRHSGPGLYRNENHIPAYTNHEGFERTYRDSSYSIHDRARGWGQTSRVPRIPFSAEAVMNPRHHGSHTHWPSGQLHTSYSSYPGSPQRLMEPEYHPGWSREIVSDVEDQHRRRRNEVQMYPRERQPVAKRHVRPTAGGAPFISCYHCSETLNLPADFLIFHRKYHFLRCGTCMNVLRFSLQDKTHLVPAFTYPQPESPRDINDRNTASGSSRNEVPKQERRSSSAKNEELPVARGSPLHRLMGYSTVSQVFKVIKRPPSPIISDKDQMPKH